LPDGIFSYQKYQFWCVLEGLGVKHFGAFNGHLVFLVLFRYIPTYFGHLVSFVAILVIFHHFGFMLQLKSGNPAFSPT
jgi:hypothetical protein